MRHSLRGTPHRQAEFLLRHAQARRVGGAVRGLGMEMWQAPDAVQRYRGISLQSNACFDNLKLWELIRLYAGLYEVFLSKAQIMDLLARFQLAEKAEAEAQQFSGGQQQR